MTVAGSSRTSVISRLVSMAGDLREVTAWGPVMAVLADELDVSRGDVLCAGEADLAVTDQFAGHLLWFDDKEMIPERSYLMKIGARTIPATVTALKHRIDVNSGAHIAARKLELNELAFCNFSLSAPVPLDSFENSRDHGSFILIDRVTNDTVGAGVVAFELRRAPNLHAQELRVDKAARAAIKGHRPAVLWMTGFSGAGKSTIANLVDLQLNALGCHTYVLDGDNVRRGLNRDLGFTEARPCREHPPGSRGSALFHRSRPYSVSFADIAVSVGTADGARAVFRWRIHRSLRRCAPGGMPSTRSEGAIP